MRSRNREEDNPLQHFIDAQDKLLGPDSVQWVYDNALELLKTGSLPPSIQWWYIFPRIVQGTEAQKNLAKRYSIKSYIEAENYYYEHHLYFNLVDAIEAIRTSGQTDLDAIFGKGARKFKPWFTDSITLFAQIESDAGDPDDHFFLDALKEFFGGVASQTTVNILHNFPDHPDNISEFDDDDAETDHEIYDEDDDHAIDPEEVASLERKDSMYALNGFIASRVEGGILQYQVDWDARFPELSWYPATVWNLNSQPMPGSAGLSRVSKHQMGC